MKNLFRILPLAVGLLAADRAMAVSYVLHSSSAVLTSGNTTSTFYQLTPPSAEAGSAASLFSSSAGGDENTGFWVSILFDSNPQPVLTSVFLKTAHEYLWWDSADLAAFNSGSFTGITLWNDEPGGIQNQNNKYQNTSHAGINGSRGTSTGNGGTVPDGGTTLVLLGGSLLGLGSVRRLMHKKA